VYIQQPNGLIGFDVFVFEILDDVNHIKIMRRRRLASALLNGE